MANAHSVLYRSWNRRIVDEAVNQHYRAYENRRPQPVGEAFIALLERDQMRLLRLCAALERIADGLPGTGREAKTGKVLSLLEKAFARHVFMHEKCLFPLIRSLEEKNESLEVILRELEFEHSADRGLLLEILSAWAGRDTGQAGLDALGYLLRSFFDNYRRHSAWERATLYPVIRTHLVGGAPRKQHDALLRVSIGAEASDRAALAY